LNGAINLGMHNIMVPYWLADNGYAIVRAYFFCFWINCHINL